ncbi:hypothetical protein ACWEOW_02990 [Monashia sp. NPDC004114]
MTVIPFPQRQAAGCHLDSADTCRSMAICGRFAGPSGRSGTMTGSLRLLRLRLGGTRAWADGVFTGELYDADGKRIGACSRRQSAPARLGQSDDAPVTIGPVDVDLMGLVVTVCAIRVPEPDGASAFTRSFRPRLHIADQPSKETS